MLIIEILTGKGGYYFRIKGTNGRTIAHSEIYTTLRHCRRIVGKIIKTVQWKVREL